MDCSDMSELFTGRHVGQWEIGDMSPLSERHPDCVLDAVAKRGDVSRMPDQPQVSDDSREREPVSMTGWLLFIGILVFSAVVTIPIIQRQRMKARQTSAISSLRGISFALFEFESEYGRFPDSVTAVEVKRKTGSPLTLGDKTSNDVFVQLLASEIVFSEIIFATHTAATRKPDDDWKSDATALESGETGFAFISGLSAKDNPSIPIVFGPVPPGAREVNPEDFDHRAVMAKLDNSVTTGSINSTGKIIINGQDLLDPSHPFWHSKAPDVKWPK